MNSSDEKEKCSARVDGTKFWTKQDPYNGFYYYYIYKKPNGKYTVVYEERFLGVVTIKWESEEASLFRCKLWLFLYHMGSQLFSEPLRKIVSFSINSVAIILVILCLLLGSLILNVLTLYILKKIGIFIQDPSLARGIIFAVCSFFMIWIINKCEKRITDRFPYLFE